MIFKSSSKRQNSTVLAKYLQCFYSTCSCPASALPSLSYTGWKIDVSGLHKEGIVTFFIHHSILQFCVDTHRGLKDQTTSSCCKHSCVVHFICYTIYIHLSFISTTIQFCQIFWKDVLSLSNKLWMFWKKNNSIGRSIAGASDTYFCHQQLTTSKTPSPSKY